MLVLIAGFTVFFSAMAAQQLAGGGGARLAIGILMGTGLGVLTMYAASRIGRHAMRSAYLAEATSPRVERRLRLVYIAMGVSTVAFGFVAFRATLALIRLCAL